MNSLSLNGPSRHVGDAGLGELLRAVAQRSNRDDTIAPMGEVLRALHSNALDHLPYPGEGATLQRWQRLAQVAAADLSLAKFYEGHTDALAILHACEADLPVAQGTWGVWAAEPPDARVLISSDQDQGQQPSGQVRITGRKAWCSGGLQVDRALLTAWDHAQRPQLVAIRLGLPGLRVISEHWQALGMAATQTLDLEFTDYPARLIGRAGQYVERPGFWHGGMGIAACWYGGAAGLADHLRAHCRAPNASPHALAHLGGVDAALAGARATLRENAHWVDANPQADAHYRALQVRAQVEAAVQQVIDHAGRALGAAPLCRNSHFARLMADLPVFLRQSHAERDLAALAEHLLHASEDVWRL